MNRVIRARSARAFTMAEAVLSVFIVGVVLVAALHTVGASRAAQQKVGDRARGMLLAQDLMTEILQYAYEDPASGPGSFGLGADEVGDGSRSLWDDVDDYEGWSASPPQRADGEPIEGFVGWGRRVAVDWVDPDDLTQTLLYDSGVKRITVTVTHHDVPVASLVAVRTSVWPDSGD